MLNIPAKWIVVEIRIEGGCAAFIFTSQVYKRPRGRSRVQPALIPDGRLRLLHISFDVRKGKKRARGTAILNSPPFLVLVGLPFFLVVL